jgi:RNA polymerase sigma-70 factor (ECF subfamily)
MHDNQNNPLRAQNVFRTTQWTVILNAKNPLASENTGALESLCAAYWYPLYFFVRRRGHSEQDAKDLVQGFFSKLLEKQYLSAVDRSQGKFRTFLLTALSGYLCNEHDRKTAQKRGGGRPAISIDAEEGEERYRMELVSQVLSPDEQFEKVWAETVVDCVMRRLQSEAAAAGQAERFAALTECLMEKSETGYEELGKRTDLSEGGVKTAVRRLRHRFGAILREELSRTVASPEAVDEDLRHLLNVLRK